MATGLYPNNAGAQRIYAAKLLLGVEGFVDPTKIQCCGVRPSNVLPLSIVVNIDCQLYIFTGLTADVYNVLLGLLIVNGRHATAVETSDTVRAALAQSINISLSADIFDCRYIVGRVVRVFQRHDALENLLLNGANQPVHAGDGSKIFVGA